MNLTTRLRGTAYSFYRSCTPEQHSSYPLLVGELKKRFTPVQLTVIQTQMFRDRQQGPKESVDDYTQALRKLFSKAYSSMLRGPESNTMSQTVLANQFISGLRPDLKAKVVGTEGKLEQLVMKARFEEAKKRELSTSRTAPLPRSDSCTPPSSTQRNVPPISVSDPKSKTCYNCGLKGHMARSCPYPRQQKADKEARGRKDTSVACVETGTQGGTSQTPEEKIEELRRKLHEAELAAAVGEAGNVIRNVTNSDKSSGSALGPTITSQVQVNGISTDALVDTGSPVTIISLDFAMIVSAKERTKFQGWKEATLMKFEAPEVSLRTYGGGRLDVLAQMPVRITRGNYHTDVKVLVRKGAPNRLLLGTDAQIPLGFSMFKKEAENSGVDLITGELLSIGNEASEPPKPPQGGDGVGSVDQHLLPTGGAVTYQEQTPPRTKDLPLDSDQAVVARLLQATRIAPGYKKMMRARVEGDIPHKLFLFTPVPVKPDVVMADGAVEFSDDRCVVLVVQNHGVVPAKLKKGQALGEVSPVSEYVPREGSNIEDAGSKGQPAATVCGLTPTQDLAPARGDLLLKQLGPKLDHLSPEEQQQLRSLILTYADTFAVDAGELGTTNVVKHSINTGDHPPIKQPLRRTPFALRAKVDELVRDMLSQGVIEPSQSPWACPVVLVNKKDGGLRFCVDYRQLNHVTKLDEFPLPRIDDTLDQLAGAKFFSTLDLASGYWQVAMDPGSQEKTAFSTYSGLYEFRKMPFGLVNAPATFQRLMEVVLAGLAREGCLVYLDDVLVMGKTLEEHNENLEKVFCRLRAAGLCLKPKKCSNQKSNTWATLCQLKGSGLARGKLKLLPISPPRLM